MQVGDLVRDKYGHVGVIIETALLGNDKAALVRFHPDAGYDSEETWISRRYLEVINCT